MKVMRGMRRNMVQAEAQNQEEAFNLDILDSPSGLKLADKIHVACRGAFKQEAVFHGVPDREGIWRQDWAGGFMRLICNRRKGVCGALSLCQGGQLSRG